MPTRSLACFWGWRAPATQSVRRNGCQRQQIPSLSPTRSVRLKCQRWARARSCARTQGAGRPRAAGPPVAAHAGDDRRRRADCRGRRRHAVEPRPQLSRPVQQCGGQRRGRHHRRAAADERAVPLRGRRQRHHGARSQRTRGPPEAGGAGAAQGRPGRLRADGEPEVRHQPVCRTGQLPARPGGRAGPHHPGHAGGAVRPRAPGAVQAVGVRARAGQAQRLGAAQAVSGPHARPLPGAGHRPPARQQRAGPAAGQRDGGRPVGPAAVGVVPGQRLGPGPDPGSITSATSSRATSSASRPSSARWWAKTTCAPR